MLVIKGVLINGLRCNGCGVTRSPITARQVKTSFQDKIHSSVLLASFLGFIRCGRAAFPS